MNATLQSSAMRALLAGAALATWSCSPDSEPILECEPFANARPVCGFTRPEDLEVLPSGSVLVVSQMGKFDGVSTGTLALFDLASEAITPAFPRTEGAAAFPSAGWGDPACPGPPSTFSPHGLSLARRPDGALQLLVVNHGREAVEVFGVTENAPVPELTWRGCVLAPEPLLMNDVAALPDGGFVATHMWPKGSDTWYGILGMLGFSTGHVVEWHPGSALRKVEGSDAGLPNGISASSNGETLYVNHYFSGEVVKISRSTGEVIGRADVAHPDNSSWSSEGTLLVASHDASVPEVLACNDVERGACGARYSIVEVDTETMTTRKVYENEGPPMGAGTVAVRAGGELIIGSFVGDRIVRVTLAD